MTTIRRTLVTASLVALALTAAGAAPPASIRVQGSITDRSGGLPVPANGTYAMKFSLYDAITGGSLIASAGPTSVQVLAGLYNADVPFPPSAFAGANLFLEVEINGEVLAPRIPIVSVPYAYQAGQASQAGAVTPGAIVTASLAPAAVTADKLGIPCADGQILIRSGGAWVCGAPPLQVVCNENDLITCYTGPAGTANVGTCRYGQRACAPGGTGFGACAGEVLPAPDTTCDGKDNDCDGVVDDNCAVCGNGVVEPLETCDDANTTAGDGCSALCQTESGYTCSGQPSACFIICSPGTSSCDHINANGCECQTTACCGGVCAGVHQNGLGQTYENCTQPGVPGNAATYTLAMAIQARAAWPVTGNDFSIVNHCSGEAVTLRQTPTSCAVWVYTGPLAGYVKLNTASNFCLCPTSTADTSWN